MAQYGISLKEILARTVIVEAGDIDEAIQKVWNAVKSGEIILDADDYIDREIEPSENWDNGKIPIGEDVSYFWHIR